MGGATGEAAEGPAAATLLLVEDNDIDAFLVQRLLRRVAAPVDFIRAVDGEEALAVIRRRDAGTRPSRAPLLALVDINMPRMNGLEFLDALEAEPPRGPVGPVYMLTTSSSPRDREAALGHPCVRDYLVKPLDRTALQRMLADLLDAGPVHRKG